MQQPLHFYSGTSGLVVPVPQSMFPPAFRGKSRLCYYAALFNSIEINSTFYKTPKPETVRKWVSMVPDHFSFTFKLPKAISHAKNLLFNEADVTAFMEVIHAAENKKGCLLIQLPPSLKSHTLQQLEKLLALLQQGLAGKWKKAVEFRDTSWYNDEVYALLEAGHAAMVVHDMPASSTPLITASTPFSYFRLHGPGGRYRGSYTNESLEKYARVMQLQLQQGKIVFCYFNNTMGEAVANLQTLVKMVSGTAY